MLKIIRRVRVLSWIDLFVYFGAAISIALCYLFLVENKTSIFNIYIISSVSVIASIGFFQFIVGLYTCYKLEKNRHVTNLKATDIVGNDIGAAYDFGQIGLIVIDAQGVILWVNDFLIGRENNIVDNNIKDFSVDLFNLYEQSLQDADYTDSCVFKKGSKFYQAKYISDASLFILKDCTDYESLLIYNQDHLSVVGYLNIDNYADVPSSSDYEKASIDTSIRKMIFEYFKKYDVLVKPLSTSSYLLLLVKEDYEKLVFDKFSLIPSFAKSFANKGLTITMGFGYGFPDYNKNNELATSALDVALSRGGNQCVVAPFGESMLFYGGGNTESVNQTNKVKILTFAKSFFANIQHASNVIIVPHYMADMDAIGAALGVLCICKAAKVDAKIAYASKFVESGTDHAARSNLPLNYFSDVFINLSTAVTLKKPDTLIIMVDHNSPKQSIFSSLIDVRYDKIAIVDHHRKQNDSVEDTVFEHIDSSASSTCELLALYFDSYNIKIDVSKEIATIMMSGIYLDTINFRTKTRILTHEACIILSRLGAYEALARDFLKENYEFFEVKSKIVSNVQTYSRGILIACGDDDTIVNPALLASVCNELREVESTMACFAIGKFDETTIGISSRGNGQVNCEDLMRRMGGGGHFSAAATRLQVTSVDEALKQLTHILDEYLKDATNTVNKISDDE